MFEAGSGDEAILDNLLPGCPGLTVRRIKRKRWSMGLTRRDDSGQKTEEPAPIRPFILPEGECTVTVAGSGWSLSLPVERDTAMRVCTLVLGSRGGG